MKSTFKIISTPENEDDGAKYTVKQVDISKEEYESTTEFNPMLKFFKYENGNFELNKEELLLIPEAKRIIHADKGGKITGDYDGRRKLWAIKQFGVAWWIVNVNSPGIQSGLEGKELMKDAMKSLEIEDWKYSEDIVFMEFVTVYKNMYKKAAYSTMLKQMLMSFNDTADVIKIIRDNTVKILKTDKDITPEDIAALMSYQKEIVNLTGDVPKQISKLKDLQELVHKEEKAFEMGRAGIKVSKSMQPNE